jgi:cysteinyl-tRNA synthetase
MSVTHLGTQIDIHGGGRDLCYPHHENEIAQAECASGDIPFCGYWLHCGMLKLDGTKMSKSLGNLVLARDLMETFEPDHLRLYLLSNHYRSDPDFYRGSLEALTERFGRLKSAVERASGDSRPLQPVIGERLDDDFDTPGAFDLADVSARRVLDGSAEEGEAEALRAALAALGFAFAGAKGPAAPD